MKIDYTGCNPIIAEALKRGEREEVTDTRNGRKWHVCGYNEHSYWLLDGIESRVVTYLRFEHNFSIKAFPKPGDMLMYWNDTTEACHVAGPLGRVSSEGMFFVTGIKYGFRHCARLDVNLLGTPPSSWPNGVETW